MLYGEIIEFYGHTSLWLLRYMIIENIVKCECWICAIASHFDTYMEHVSEGSITEIRTVPSFSSWQSLSPPQCPEHATIPIASE